MAQMKMYPAVNNSPQTSLAAALTAAATDISLTDAGALPDAPNLCTIGTDEDAEVVLYAAKNGNTLTGCVRGYYGTTAKAWAALSSVYRGFTAYDHDAFMQNITDLYKQVNAAMVQGTHVYGVRWDKTNATMTRLFEAADITTDTTNFAHRGSINANYSNPFDKLYPWSAMKQCNVDLTKYRALIAGEDIRDAVVAWYGEPGFKDDGSNGFVGAYRPPFWYTAYEDGDTVIFAVASGKMEGWRESPAYIRGYGFATDAGNNLLSCDNGQPLTNVAVSTLHSRAKAGGFTIEDIYTVSGEDTLMIVEYANMNMQSAIGNGCDGNYRENDADKPHIAETGATRVVLPAAFAAFAVEGATLDFGATKGAVIAANRRKCLGYEEYSEEGYISVNFDQALDVTTDMFVSVHGVVNGAAIGNASGYIGANGKANAFYRGSVGWANRWRYVLGAYRQTGTGAIWMCEDPDACDDYDALDTSVHKNTGLILPTSNNYIKSLGLVDGMGALPFCTEVGGSSSAPVGDYVYVPSLSTGNTIMLLGGDASTGAGCGPFSASWNRAASSSSWTCAALPVLKSP